MAKRACDASRALSGGLALPKASSGEVGASSGRPILCSPLTGGYRPPNRLLGVPYSDSNTRTRPSKKKRSGCCAVPLLARSASPAKLAGILISPMAKMCTSCATRAVVAGRWTAAVQVPPCLGGPNVRHGQARLFEPIHVDRLELLPSVAQRQNVRGMAGVAPLLRLVDMGLLTAPLGPYEGDQGGRLPVNRAVTVGSRVAQKRRRSGVRPSSIAQLAAVAKAPVESLAASPTASAALVLAFRQPNAATTAAGGRGARWPARPVAVAVGPG